MQPCRRCIQLDEAIVRLHHKCLPLTQYIDSEHTLAHLGNVFGVNDAQATPAASAAKGDEQSS